MSRNLQLSFSSNSHEQDYPSPASKLLHLLCVGDAIHPLVVRPEDRRAVGVQAAPKGSLQRNETSSLNSHKPCCVCPFRNPKESFPSHLKALRTSVLRRLNPNLPSQPRPIPGISRRPASLPRHAIQVLPGQGSGFRTGLISMLDVSIVASTVLQLVLLLPLF